MVRNIEVQNTFSGPLDLLLYLVRRDEIDIHDIPVGHVTREYLLELNKMQEIDVDAGGEFLAMASMLTEIKGRMLLPDITEEEDEDDEIYDPRQGLVEALLEYKKFKEVAAELETLSQEFDSRYSRAVKEPEFQAVVKEKAEELGALDLFAAFQRIARRMLNERAPREIVSEEVPTEIRIQQIEEVVALRGRVSFSSILSDSPSEDEMVGFFIAMLELIRMRKIQAQQAIDFSEIYFIPVSESEAEESESEAEMVEKNAPEILPESAIGIGISRFSMTGSALSCAFGIKKGIRVAAAQKRAYPANRFDFLNRTKKYARKNIEEYNTQGMKFPPRLVSHAVVSGCLKTANYRGAEKSAIQETAKQIKENIKESVNQLKHYRFGLADMFSAVVSRGTINKQQTVCIIRKRDMFDIFRGRKLLALRSMTCTDKKVFLSLRFCRKPEKYGLKYNGFSKVEKLREKQNENDNIGCRKSASQIIGSIRKLSFAGLSDIFPLKRKHKKAVMQNKAYVIRNRFAILYKRNFAVSLPKSDTGIRAFLSLRFSSGLNYGKKKYAAMPGCQSEQLRSAESSCKDHLIQDMTGVMKPGRKSVCGLSDMFRMKQAGRSGAADNSTELKQRNAFDGLLLKTGSRKISPPDGSGYKYKGFLRVSCGRIIEHKILYSEKICEKVPEIKNTENAGVRIQPAMRSGVRLSSAFELQKAGMNTEDKSITEYKGFLVLNSSKKISTGCAVSGKNFLGLKK